VPNFSQLVLNADADLGLVFKLNKGVEQKDLTSVSEYSFISIGENGFFRAGLSVGGCWCAGGVVLSDSRGDVRAVRYDAEGVEPKKFKTSDLVSVLTADFLKKFD